MAKKCTLIDIVLMVECFVSMSVFSGTRQISSGTVD